MPLSIDSTTLVLSVALIVLSLISLSLRPPPPNSHPFLLGRQSLASRSRYPDESPVYNSSSSGGLRPPVRPDRRTQTLKDVVDNSPSTVVQSTSLKPDVVAAGKGKEESDKIAPRLEHIKRGLLGLLPASGAGKKNNRVAVWIDDPADALLVTLALALSPVKPIVLSPSAPNAPLPAELASSLKAIIHSASRTESAHALVSGNSIRMICYGEGGVSEKELVQAGKAQALGTEDVVSEEPNDLALTIVTRGASTKGPSITALPFTHVNLTSALNTVLSGYPNTPTPTKPTEHDVILSLHHPSTPYGLTLALFALYSGAALHLLAPDALSTTPEQIEDDFAAAPELTSLFQRVSPTIVYGPAASVAPALYVHLLRHMARNTGMASWSFLVERARAVKLSLLRHAGVLSKTTIWDKLIFGPTKQRGAVGQLKVIFLDSNSAPTRVSRFEFFRLFLGIPVINLLSNDWMLVPISQGLMWDVQSLPVPGALGKEGDPDFHHVGPPTIGVELKVRGVESDFEKSRVRGEILVRSPSLPPLSQSSEGVAAYGIGKSRVHVDSVLPSLPAYPGQRQGSGAASSPTAGGASFDESGSRGKDVGVAWFRTGVVGEIGSEGALCVS